MDINISYDRPEADDPRAGPVKVGWLLTDPKGGIIFDPPERVRSGEMSKTHAKSASRCPAVINLESRYFVIRCPFDLNLALVRDKDGKPGLKNLSGNASAVGAKKLAQHLTVTSGQDARLVWDVAACGAYGALGRALGGSAGIPRGVAWRPRRGRSLLVAEVVALSCWTPRPLLPPGVGLA